MVKFTKKFPNHFSYYYDDIFTPKEINRKYRQKWQKRQFLVHPTVREFEQKIFFQFSEPVCRNWIVFWKSRGGQRVLKNRKIDGSSSFLLVGIYVWMTFKTTPRDENRELMDENGEKRKVKLVSRTYAIRTRSRIFLFSLIKFSLGK